jgi:hypothetical protein
MDNAPEGFPEQVRDVRVMRVQEGDVVIAYTKNQLSMEDQVAVHDTLSSIWPLNKVLVIDGDMELAVGRGGQTTGPDPAVGPESGPEA